MPKLTVAVDSLDAVEEAYRPLYVQKGEKFVLDADIEDASAIKAKNGELLNETKAERRKRQELEQKLAALEAEKEAAAHGLTSEKLAEWQRKAEEKFAPTVAALEQANAKIRAMQLDGTVKSLLAKANAVDVNDAWDVVGKEFDLTDDGKVILKSDPTADVEKYITADLVAKKGHLFKGTQAAGGGAAGQQGASIASGSKPVTQWSSEERASFIEKHGAEALASLRDQQMREALKPKIAA